MTKGPNSVNDERIRCFGKGHANRMRLRLCSVWVIFLAALLSAQQTLDNDAILKLVKAGLSEDVIVGMVNAQPGKYATTTDNVIALKAAGVSDRVIAAMVNKGAPAVSAAPSSQVASTSTAPTQSSSASLLGRKAIAFAIADANGGVHPGMPGWISDWIRKNAKKYPDVSFQQGGPAQGADNYLVVLSTSANALHGFDPVVRTNTSSDTSPVSGTGTVTDNRGSTWNYTYQGQVTTTTTTTTRENVPYTIESKTLCLTAFDLRGVIVTQRWHTYSSKEGGEAASGIGYNLGSVLRSINARNRLLNTVLEDIAGKKK
jgi:hypothetical protein